MSEDSYEEKIAQTYDRVKVDEESFSDPLTDSEEEQEESYDESTSYDEDEFEEYIDELPNILVDLGFKDPDIIQILGDLRSYLDGEIQDVSDEYLEMLENLYNTIFEFAGENVGRFIYDAIENTRDLPLSMMKSAYDYIVKKQLEEVFVDNRGRFDKDIARIRKGKTVRDLPAGSDYDLGFLRKMSQMLPLDRTEFSSDILNIMYIFSEEDPDDEEDISDYAQSMISAIDAMFTTRGYSPKRVASMLRFSDYNELRFTVLRTAGLPTVLVHPNVNHGSKGDAKALVHIGEIVVADSSIKEVILISKKPPTPHAVKGLAILVNGKGKSVPWSYIPHRTVLARPIAHGSYDEHVVLDKDTADEPIRIYGVDGLPTYRKDDPICSYLGFRVGQVIMIKRTNRVKDGNNISVHPGPPGYRLVKEV